MVHPAHLPDGHPPTFPLGIPGTWDSTDRGDNACRIKVVDFYLWIYYYINEKASAIGSESILFVGLKLRQVWHSRVQNCTDFERKKNFFVHQAHTK